MDTIDITNKHKILNSKCICGQGLIWKKYGQIMLDPCEHILHLKCYTSQSDIIKCPICHCHITEIHTLDSLAEKITHSKKKYYQKYVDMVSMCNFENYYKGKSNIVNLVDLFGIALQLPFLSGHKDGKRSCKEILSLIGGKIIACGMDNLKAHTGPRVYIANHTSYLDMIVLFYLFNCGFLSSSYIQKVWIGKKILDIIPLLLVERGKNENTVQKIQEYVQQTGSICLFPEGIITHPDTIVRFRTGAFHAGFPIIPVVIRYDPVVYDANIIRFAEKLTSEPNITIHVDVLPVEHPPFSSAHIELIRKKMAKAGNLARSRVSNKDIVDK